jgi:DNA-binding NarL/FixJ family response regulator
VAFLEFDPARVRAIRQACYAFQGSLDGWADGVHAALAPALDQGQGTLVALVEFPDTGLILRQVRRLGDAARVHTAVVRLSAFLAPQRLRESFFNGRVLGSSSGHYAGDELAALRARAGTVRSRDAAGWCVNDGVDHGFMVVSPSRKTLALPSRPSAVVRHLGQHVATGLRLQRLVSGSGLDDPAVEAIFDEQGRARHALGMARGADQLELLRAAVVHRSKLLEVDAAGAEDGWAAVIAGRWSLVDRFDSDGQRFVVAYRNPPGMLDPRRLTPREEGVATLAALGSSNKEIGAQLQISDSTVATLVATALGKLGLESRALLPLFWRDLHGRARAIDGSDARLIALGRPDDFDGMAALTPAERDVAKGLLSGLSDKDIARERKCSRRTVAKHAAAVYRKLGVRSRWELASRLAGGVAAE